MSFGFGVGDVIAVSTLAARVHSCYKDAPDEYKYILEDVRSLQIIIDGAKHYFENSTLSGDKCLEAQEVLQGCQSVLQELDCLVTKYQSIAIPKRWQFWKRVKFGNKNIMALRTRLTSNTILLSNFIRRFVLAICHIAQGTWYMLIPLSSICLVVSTVRHRNG